LAAEAAAAKKHDDDYKALVRAAQERDEMAPRKEPYVKPSTRHCHLIQLGLHVITPAAYHARRRTNAAKLAKLNPLPT
jgi:hypothetical protein